MTTNAGFHILPAQPGYFVLKNRRRGVAGKVHEDDYLPVPVIAWRVVNVGRDDEPVYIAEPVTTMDPDDPPCPVPVLGPSGAVTEFTAAYESLAEYVRAQNRHRARAAECGSAWQPAKAPDQP